MKSILKWLLPLVVLGLGIGTISLLHFFKPKTEDKIPPAVIAPVTYVETERGPQTLSVVSEGTVEAATESQLVPEVSGRIIDRGPGFYDGRFVAAGEVLLRIEALNYEAAVANAESALAGARLQLDQELAQGAQARAEWRELGRGEPTALTLREPQQALSRAQIAAAEVALKMAKRDLERTEIRAPFAGRIRSTQVDVGQVVTANMTPLATIYAVDQVEIRLPLSLREIAYLDLNESYRGEATPESRAPVVVRARYGSETYQWDGYIDRVEGAIDPRTRLIYAVAVVDDPYSRQTEVPERPPLKVGIFVEARIEGRTLPAACVLPRIVMVREDTVYVIDDEGRLRSRLVQVAKADAQTVVISAGLETGDHVNITPVDFFIEGMPVSASLASDDELKALRPEGTRQ